MGKRLKNLNKTNIPLLVFATVLVVSGITVVAYFSSQHPGGAVQSVKQAVSKVVSPEQPPAAVVTGTIWLANADAVTVRRFDGTSQRLSWEDFEKKYTTKTWPAQGSLAASGSLKSFAPPEMASGSHSLLLSPDRRYQAVLGQPKSDNAAVIDVVQGKEKPQSVVLRDRKGKALEDPQLLGWLGLRTLAVSAVATSSRWLYSVEMNGALRQLAPLPDNVVYAEVRAGALWYATAVLGEGLETPPKGPSDLHRVDLDGQDLVVAHDDLRVFQSAVPDTAGHLMYATDDGQAFYLKIGDSSSRQMLGKRRPLLILSDGRLVLRDGFDLVLYDPATAQSKALGALPEGDVSVFEGTP